METIKDRLVRIISSEGLTSSAFADIIGVQRSSISHILSGRNKPSLDFLQKIITKFGKYNAEWLIVGTGEVYKQPKQSSIFDNKEVGPEPDSAEKIDSIAKKEEETPKNHENVVVDVPKTENITNYIEDTSVDKENKIEKVLIFYKNGTFREYTPQN